VRGVVEEVRHESKTPRCVRCVFLRSNGELRCDRELSLQTYVK
jgi:hypothetical protein